MSLSLFESVYKPRAGGTTTKAVTRTISGTDLSQTEVLLREAIQNSYDAKIDNTSSLKLNLNCYKLKKENCNIIIDLLKNAGKLGIALSKPISQAFYNLEITDRNTTGLSGYCGFQENQSSQEEKFHHFIYMTGNDEVKDKESGGSFGFGKAALYRYSDLRTIVVYSKVFSKQLNKYQTRFIICKIDERLNEYESRCWWGSEGTYNDGTTYAKPLTDSNADELAELFGMQKFGTAETGTDILILKPILTKDFESFNECFKDEIPILLTHWFWPKMITQKTDKKIDFQLFLDGYDITDYIPAPQNTYPYSAFCRAFRNCVDYYSHKAGASTEEVKLVKFERPYVEIGGIFLKKQGFGTFNYEKYININWNKPHIALMRDIEFIVKYQEVDIDTNNIGVNCFGIFHTNRLGHQKNSEDNQEIEHYFRDIENQTHDKWTHNDSLPYRNYLKKVENAIPESVKSFLNVKSSIGNAASISGLVAQKIGSKLGFGFIGGASTSATDSNFSGTKTSEKKSSFIRRNEPTEVKLINNEKFIIINYDAKILKNKKLLINLTPVIQSFDPHDKEIALDTELKIAYITHKNKDLLYKIPPIPPKNIFNITESGIYSLYVQANIDCAFDIAISKEEFDV